MTHPTTLLRAVLLATAIAAPSVTLADGPTEDITFYSGGLDLKHHRSRFGWKAQQASLLTPIDPLPAKVHGDGSETARKGAWILDTSPAGTAAAPASKPKEIVVVGPKPAARSDFGQQLQLRLPESNVHRPAASPAVVAAPTKPQPHTLIELPRR